MKQDLVADALKEIQTLWLTSMALSIAWLVFLPTGISQLHKYNAALHLTAWKLLTDLTKQLPVPGDGSSLVTGYVKSRPQSNYIGETPPRYPAPLFGMTCTQDTACDALTADAVWPQPRTVNVFLSSEDLQPVDEFKGSQWTPDIASKLQHFRVVSRAGDLPLNDYMVVREVRNDPAGYFVTALADTWTAVALSEWPGTKLALKARPLLESDILGYLHAASLDAITDAELQKFQEEASLSQATADFAGIKINAAYALPAIGAALAAVAFLLLGPLAALGNAEPGQSASVWVLAVDVRRHPYLRAASAVVAGTWAVTPLALALAQLLVRLPLPLGLEILRWISCACLIFAAIVFWRCAAALRIVRAAVIPAPIAANSTADLQPPRGPDAPAG